MRNTQTKIISEFKCLLSLMYYLVINQGIIDVNVNIVLFVYIMILSKYFYKQFCFHLPIPIFTVHKIGQPSLEHTCSRSLN